LASVGSDLSVKDAYDSLVPGPENKTITGRGSLYFAKLSDFYYLCYFALIGVFGIYWAVKTNNNHCMSVDAMVGYSNFHGGAFRTQLDHSIIEEITQRVAVEYVCV